MITVSYYYKIYNYSQNTLKYAQLTNSLTKVILMENMSNMIIFKMRIGKVKVINDNLGVPYRGYERVKYFTDNPDFALKYSCPHEYDFKDEIKNEKEEGRQLFLNLNTTFLILKKIISLKFASGFNIKTEKVNQLTIAKVLTGRVMDISDQEIEKNHWKGGIESNEKNFEEESKEDVNYDRYLILTYSYSLKVNSLQNQLDRVNKYGVVMLIIQFTIKGTSVWAIYKATKYYQ